MLHGTRREVAFCLLLLTIVVSITLYLTVFSLHGSNAAMKVQMKSKYLKNFKSNLIVFDRSPYLMTYDLTSRTNYTIHYRADGTLPLNTGEIHNEEEMHYHRREMSNHAFNALISDRIGPVARPIPDTRNELCGLRSYSNISITASVIICFYKESFSALLRTVASVVERTPPQLLQEVILVDDFSNTEAEDYKIMRFLEQHYPYGKVRIVSMDKRVGLIKARIKGAKEASGDVLIYLDSHCEPNVGWIEPLLDIIQKSRNTIVCPIVDIINPNTMVYTSSPIMRGGFNWGLHFTWEALPKELKDPSEPFMSPTMSGGLFAVDRVYFSEIGYYDEEMREWGGENLELSFRVWMCGGELIIAPCSRVGHIFRNRRPNAIKGEDNPTKNAARVAAVWLDGYKKLFWSSRATAKSSDYGDVAKRIKLRSDLHCHDFKWFLMNIYPEIAIPGERSSLIKIYRPSEMSSEVVRGHIRLHGIDLCLSSDNAKGSLIYAKKCDQSSPSQLWRFMNTGELRFGDNSRFCMDAASSENPRLLKCNGAEGTQKWEFYPRRTHQNGGDLFGRLYSVSEGLCLQLSGGNLSEQYELLMQICDQPTVQMFTIHPV